jgi:hypothetical protein
MMPQWSWRIESYSVRFRREAVDLYAIYEPVESL